MICRVNIQAHGTCTGSHYRIPVPAQFLSRFFLPPFNLKRKMGVFVELALSEVFDFGFVWW